MLVEASLSQITPYDVNQNYTPEEMEPYDAMSGRFIRAVEVSLKFFRTYERYLFAESSDTIRDLLNRMATVDLITSTQLWVAMRDVRNRIVHDYLPKDIKQIYDAIQNQFGNELKQLKSKLIDLSID
jgi:nucleotidyltransferase substrate binding protein (TIGR01987 family)